MRITKINIPKAAGLNDGLEDIKMNKLGQVVLIAGKNGAGKTRILNKIFDTIKSKPVLSHINNLTATTAQLLRNIEDREGHIKTYEIQYEGTTHAGNIAHRDSQITMWKNQIEQYKNQIKSQE